MKFVFRPAVPADVPEIHQLVNSAYRGESSKKGWTTEADILGGQRIDEERLHEMLQEENQTLLCMFDERGDLCGSVSLERFEDDKGKSCYLGMLTIRPTSQAGGLGKQLMQEAEKFAKSRGANRMTLGVIQLRTELMAWYERRGYTKTGEREEFPYDDIRFGEPKRDDLFFVMFEKML